jgi:SRSO17 transposase
MLNDKKRILVVSTTKKIEEGLTDIQKIFSDCFKRSETKELALYYFKGLLSNIERKNSWQLAEQTGYNNPYGFQYLLGRAVWDVNNLKNALQNYTLRNLGEKKGILSIDETGFLKKGNQSAGVARQYSGTAGRIENCQIGVFLSYSTNKGRALIDRELYLPNEWFEDKGRCLAAGIPKTAVFKTKTELAKEMLEKAFERKICPEWVVGDEVYSCYSIRNFLEQRRQAYALAVASNHTVYIGWKQYRVNELLENINKNKWETLSCGKGSKGHRYYQWNSVKINSDAPRGWHCLLLFRRKIKAPDEISFYTVFSSKKATLENIVKAIGSRWTIEECFEMAKGEVGLDQYEVRSWQGWYRHITLSMLGLSFLSRLRIQLNEKIPLAAKKKRKCRSMEKFLAKRGLA